MAKKLRTKKNKKMISWWGWMVGVKLAFSKFCSKKNRKIDLLKSDVLPPKKTVLGLY